MEQQLLPGRRGKIPVGELLPMQIVGIEGSAHLQSGQDNGSAGMALLPHPGWHCCHIQRPQGDRKGLGKECWECNNPGGGTRP